MTLLTPALVLIACVAMAALPPLHPAQLWAIVWALAVGAYSLRLLPYDNLGVVAQLLIGGASLGFVGGTLAGERLGRRLLSHFGALRRPPRDTDLRLAAAIVLATTLFGLSGFLLQAVRAYGLRAALVSSPPVRLAVHTGMFHITIKYIYAAVAASALCGACTAIGPHRRLWALATAVAVLSTYFATGRATIVVATMTALSAYALVRPRLPSKRSFLLGACIITMVALGIFTLGGSLIGKTLSNSELASIESPLVRHALLRPVALPYLYLSAPVAAFGLEVALADRLPHFYGCASFGYVCSALAHAGFHVPSFPEVRPFTAAPLKWNTYTWLDAPLLDGGIWMVIPATTLAGIFFGALWLAARQRALLGLLGYAVLMPSIVTAGGSNNFTASYLLGAVLISIGAVLAARLINPLPRRSV